MKKGVSFGLLFLLVGIFLLGNFVNAGNGYCATCPSAVGCSENDCYNVPGNIICTIRWDSGSCGATVNGGQYGYPGSGGCGSSAPVCTSPENLACGSIDAQSNCAGSCSNTGTKCSNGLTCSSGICGPYGNALDQGIVSYWPFDTATGSNSTLAVDVVGRNNLTVFGALNGSVGVKNEAYNFKGVINDYLLSFSYSPLYGPYFFNAPSSNMTLCAWIKTKSVNATIMQINRGGEVNHEFVFQINNAVLNFWDYTSDYGKPTNNWGKSITPVNDGNWHLVCFVKNHINGTYYLDGRVDGYARADQNEDINYGSWASNFAIGKDYRDENNFFNGSIDEVGIWGRSLNDTEISQMYSYYGRSLTSHWEDLNGNSISSTNTGDTVTMIASGKNLDLTRDMNFSVWRNSTFMWIWKTVGLVSPASGSQFWVAEDPINNIFFKANQGTLESISGGLNVTSLDDAPPIVNITSPVADSKLQSSNAVLFSQASYDEDDLLNITWDFGDGNVTSCVNYSLGINPAKCNFEHIYSNKGAYLVKLTAKEMTREKSSQAFIWVYVFDSGINAIPVISSPSFGNSYGNFVDFNASGSYVANCSSTILNGIFTVGNLNCTYLHAPNLASSYSPSGYNLSFNWNMDGSVVAGNWNDYTSIVLFKYYFLSSGAHSSRLNLTYSFSVPSVGGSLATTSRTSGSSQVVFNTAGWSCISDANTAQWSFSNSTSTMKLNIFNSTYTNGNCSKYLADNNNHACCPNNRVCSNGVCSVENTYDYCYKITSQDACNSASSAIGKRSVESIPGNPTGICGIQKSYTFGVELCVNITGCGCSWNNTASKCVAARTDIVNCTSSSSVKSCNWIAGETQDHCGDALGKIFVDYAVSGTAVGQSWCNASRVEYPCSVSVKMPFFDLFNLVLVSAGIAIGYLVMRRKE
jgi:hypothetical protein